MNGGVYVLFGREEDFENAKRRLWGVGRRSSVSGFVLEGGVMPKMVIGGDAGPAGGLAGVLTPWVERGFFLLVRRSMVISTTYLNLPPPPCSVVGFMVTIPVRRGGLCICPCGWDWWDEGPRR